MQKLKDTLHWLYRAWPSWLLLILVITHIAACNVFPGKHSTINKIVAASTQIVGGLLVLHSINSNFTIYKGETWIRHSLRWFTQCPLFHRHQTIYVSSAAHLKISGHAAGLVITRAEKSLKKRVEILENEITSLRDELKKSEKRIMESVRSEQAQLSTQISEVNQLISELSTKVQASTIEGSKEQIFGIVLVIYGALFSIFT